MESVTCRRVTGELAPRSSQDLEFKPSDQLFCSITTAAELETEDYESSREEDTVAYYDSNGPSI